MSAAPMFAPATPEAGFYAGLNAPLAGHAAGRRPRQLSDKQRATFLGMAAARVTEEAQRREGRWLRRLDTIHKSGCRTKAQRWLALAALAEPVLARLDLATLCLGWLDAQGAFRLNRQRGLAQDAGLTECRVSRTLADLEAAGYVRRRVRRIFKQGRQWVTRVTIHLRPRFFIDLGLGHALATARTKKKAQREANLREAARRQQRAALDELEARRQRRESHQRAQGARRIAEQQQANQQRIEGEAARAALWSRLAQENPDHSPSQLRALLERLQPPKP